MDWQLKTLKIPTTPHQVYRRSQSRSCSAWHTCPYGAKNREEPGRANKDAGLWLFIMICLFLLAVGFWGLFILEILLLSRCIGQFSSDERTPPFYLGKSTCCSGFSNSLVWGNHRGIKSKQNSIIGMKLTTWWQNTKTQNNQSYQHILSDVGT